MVTKKGIGKNSSFFWIAIWNPQIICHLFICLLSTIPSDDRSQSCDAGVIAIGHPFFTKMIREYFGVLWDSAIQFENGNLYKENLETYKYYSLLS